MELEIQKFFKLNGLEKGIEILKNDYGIEVGEYDKFINLSYSQINSPKYDSLVRECRGLILDKNTFEVLCRPFDRFYNYDEDPNGKSFPIEKSVVSEKIDGSLIKVWFNTFIKEWCSGTRKMALGEGGTNLNNTFLSVVEKAMGKSVNEFMKDGVKHFTYIFEVVSPETRVVAPYKDYELYLLGIRNNETGVYVVDVFLDSYALKIGVKRPRKYKFNTVDELINTFKDLKEFDEGYVAEYNGWRIKLKNPAYLDIAHLRNNGQMSLKKIAQLVFLNEYDEYLSYFPEDRQFFQYYIDSFEKMKKEVELIWNNNKSLDKKEFALSVKDNKYSSILFELKKGRTFKEIIERISERDERCLNLLS